MLQALSPFQGGKHRPGLLRHQITFRHPAEHLHAPTFGIPSSRGNQVACWDGHITSIRGLRSLVTIVAGDVDASAVVATLQDMEIATYFQWHPNNVLTRKKGGIEHPGYYS